MVLKGLGVRNRVAGHENAGCSEVEIGREMVCPRTVGGPQQNAGVCVAHRPAPFSVQK